MNQKKIIIAGSGRSGTTWVQDCIAEANNLHTLFEPLHPIGVSEAKNLAFRYRDEAAVDPELNNFLDRVIGGSHRSLWINYRIRPDRFNVLEVGIPNAIFNARQLLKNYKKYHGKGKQGVAVKFIRANLMLPWITANYRAEVLFVTRHPCAVIASRLRLGGEDWASQRAIEGYRSDPLVLQLIQDVFDVDIGEPFSTAAALACVWCIENLLPIKWSAKAGYMVTAYENLLADPDREWSRVIQGLGLSFLPSNVMSQAPSQQVSREMQGKAFSASHLAKWRSTLSDEQLRDISLMLDRFSCAIYSIDEDLPSGQQLRLGKSD